jgi:hypothetical protein
MSEEAREYASSEGEERPLHEHLFEPVDVASIVFFRIAFGAIMMWEVWRYFSQGMIAELYITPKVNFQYLGLGWMDPLPDIGMYVVFAIWGVLGACMLVGFCYRVAAALHTLVFAYVFLCEQTRYLNHFYLVLLMSLLLTFTPAHRRFSVDAWLRPKLASDYVPAWNLYLLRFQLGLVYFYGGIHKLNPDWLRGEPMRTWLPERAHLVPFIGPYLLHEYALIIFVFGGIALDLFVVPALLWRPTRIPAFAAALLFHLFNSQFFSIGIFPWFMICATLLFFPPDWPRKLFLWLGIKRAAPCEPPPETITEAPRAGPTPRQRVVMAVAGMYVLVQALLPLRPYLYPGNMLWSEETVWFCWNMMLSDKKGEFTFRVTDKDSGETWIVHPEDYLTDFQKVLVLRRPDLILQLAHYIANEWRATGHPNVEVRAGCVVSMNGRAPQPFIDPRVDLAAEQRGFGHKSWIVPLRERYPPLQPFNWDDLSEEHFKL